MNKAPRPRRSVLYIPGSNASALSKARDLPADALILDLEDSVSPNTKAEARRQVVAAISNGGYGQREIAIRVNRLSTPWGQDDLDAVAQTGADACLLPKIESPDQVHEALRQLDAAGAPPSLSVWIMAETPRGILDLDAIAGATSRLDVIIVGTADLAKALRTDFGGDRQGLLASLSACVLAGRAHGLDILDGVHLQLDDAAGFKAACEQGRKLGFDGKTLIHPRQIATANQVFGISDSKLGGAEAILAAWEAAEQSGQGVTVMHGQLVEQLHVDEARRVVALRTAIKDLDGD